MKNLLIHISLLLTLVLIAGCAQNDQSANTDSEISDSLNRPDSESFGTTISIYKKDRITAEIIAERVLKYEALDSTMAYDLDIEILDSTGQITTRISGDSGVIRDSESLVRIFGNVKVTTDSEIYLETDYLWWNSKTDRIKSDAFVKITRDDFVVTGWGLDADNRLSSIKILNRVSGSISDLERSGD